MNHSKGILPLHFSEEEEEEEEQEDGRRKNRKNRKNKERRRGGTGGRNRVRTSRMRTGRKEFEEEKEVYLLLRPPLQTWLRGKQTSKWPLLR
jgi:hypothetical protein